MNKPVIGMTLSTALLAASALFTAAQVPEQKTPANPPPAPPVSPCPKLEVRTPTARPVKDGRPVQFTATLTGGDPKVTPIFIWSTSAGVIVSGQSTPNIE